MTKEASTKHRRSIRLRDYDYAQAGGYFVTICAHDRNCLFGEIINAEMRLNDVGETVHAEWLRSAEIRGEIVLDEFVVMPNHLHGIIFVIADGAASRSRMVGQERLRPTGPGRKSLGAFVAGFKAATTRRVNESGQSTIIGRLWQRGYYEHIIRDERDLDRIRQYIADNPGRWAQDDENPINWRWWATAGRPYDS